MLCVGTLTVRPGGAGGWVVGVVEGSFSLTIASKCVSGVDDSYAAACAPCPLPDTLASFQSGPVAGLGEVAEEAPRAGRQKGLPLLTCCAAVPGLRRSSNPRETEADGVLPLVRAVTRLCQEPALFSLSFHFHFGSVRE